MRTPTKVLLAFGFVAGAAMLTLPGTGSANAQGFYIDAPGIHVGVGHRHHRYYRGYYDGYGAYGYAPRYGYGYRSYNGCRPGFTVQDGVCKPYRGY